MNATDYRTFAASCEANARLWWSREKDYAGQVSYFLKVGDQASEAVSEHRREEASDAAEFFDGLAAQARRKARDIEARRRRFAGLALVIAA